MFQVYIHLIKNSVVNKFHGFLHQAQTIINHFFVEQNTLFIENGVFGKASVLIGTVKLALI